MKETFPLFPHQASTMAPRVDALYFYLVAVTVVFSLLIAIAILYFAIKYRRRSESELPHGIEGSLKLEIVWSVIPLLFTLTFFFWGTSIFFAMNRAPNDALQISVVAKQWMWRFQHSDGQREINELHVPIGRPVRLVMASGRTSSQLLRAGVSPGSRRPAGAASPPVVRATKPGRTTFLRRVLRDEALG